MNGKLKRIITFVLILAVTFQIMVFANSDNYYHYKGLPNLFIESQLSDTTSSIKTIGNTMYIPAGTYVINEPIFIEDGSIVGAGMDKTIIIADFENPMLPIIFAGSSPVIKDIQFSFKDGLVTGEERQGERAGLFCANYWALQKGASLTNVKFSNVGTGLYSGDYIPVESVGMPKDTVTGSGSNYECQAFSVEFDNIVVQDFSYRGVDFSAKLRTGNLWRNIYLTSGKYACDSAFYFDGEESECSVDLLTVADSRAENPIVFSGARALDAGSITLRNVTLINEKTDYVEWNKSSGYIEHLSLNDCKISNSETLVKVGSTNFLGDANNLNALHIGVLTLSAVSGMTFADDFCYFRRAEPYNDPYYITVDEYYYHADQLEKDKYRSFPTSDINLIYTKKGQISTKGSTLMRPQYRLCPYYTQYEDTDLGKMVIWTGSEWK